MAEHAGKEITQEERQQFILERASTEHKAKRDPEKLLDAKGW